MAMTLDGTSGITQMTGSIVMSGSTSGTTTIIPSAVAGTTTVTMPAATGTMMVSGNMPAFSAYSATQQNISSNTWTKVVCATEEFDTNSAYDNVTNYRFQPLVSGYYQVTGGIYMGATGTSITNASIAIYKNGASYKQSQIVISTMSSLNPSISCLVFLNGSTDYVELYGNFQATSPYFYNTSNQTFFQATMTRGA